jgi:tRNA-specific adenosine deaminase 1
MEALQPISKKRKLPASEEMQGAAAAAVPGGAGAVAAPGRNIVPGAVSAAALACWAALPKTGKPQPHEHTVVAAFVMSSGGERCIGGTATAQQQQQHNAAGHLSDVHYQVVALGSGTKCLSAPARSPDGSLLNDSHAEVIARRALQRWLYGELKAAADAAAAEAAGAGLSESRSGDGSSPDAEAAEAAATGAGATAGSRFFHCPPLSTDSLDTQSGAREVGRACLRAGCQLHMWVSQAPCGDASIVGKSAGWQLQGEAAGPRPGQRTGAKLISAPFADDLHPASRRSVQVVPGAADVEPDAAPQQEACLRRKPGRGAATLSMSCSDKLARWVCLGMQV